MQINRHFLFFVMLFSAYQCYCRNINDVLSDNPALEVTPDGFLDLHNMHIDSLEGLENIPQISETKRIDLSSNHLTELNDGAFLMMPKLDTVNLMLNGLTRVGKHLFNRSGVQVFVSYNRLPEDQLDGLRNQLEPGFMWRYFSRSFHLLDKATHFVNWLAGPDYRQWRIAGYSLRDLIHWGVSMGLFGGLKYALSNPRFTKANLALDTVCHGANIAAFIIMLLRRRAIGAGYKFVNSDRTAVMPMPQSLFRRFPPVSVRDCLNCVENGVHLYNMYKSPATVSGNIRSRTSIDLKSFTTNRWVWAISWLPFLRLIPRVRIPIQDSLMAPWALSPSKYYKFVEGARGFSLLNNVISLPILNKVRVLVNRQAELNSGILFSSRQNPACVPVSHLTA